MSSVIYLLATSCVAIFDWVKKSRAKERRMAEIHWSDDMNAALTRAKIEGKPVLLDFFNPG